MRSANPVLQDNTFQRVANTTTDTMTAQGVVWKTFILLVIVCLSSMWTWNMYVKSGQNPATVSPWLMGGAIGGFIVALITAFKPAWSAITAPIYAALQGLFIGALSAMMEQSYPGIVIQAATLTFATLAAMLLLYETKIIQVTETFKMIVFTATGGIAIAYLLTWILSFFSIDVPFINSNGIGGIVFSLFVIGIAALNFVIDFDFIDKGAESGAPKYMEWYGAFALMVTLIWLYIEFLRLLGKIRSRE